MALEAYEKVQKIRKVAAEARAAEVLVETVSQIEDQARAIVEERIQEFVDASVAEHLSQRREGGRHKELESHLKEATVQLVARIDHGYRLEARVDVTAAAEADGKEVEPNVDADPDLAEQIQQLRELAQKRRYFEAETSPILNLPKPKREAS
ncbi:MAG: hypothetical protein ACR2OX_02960 [Methyloligellaceae bacterium]